MFAFLVVDGLIKKHIHTLILPRLRGQQGVFESCYNKRMTQDVVGNFDKRATEVLRMLVVKYLQHGEPVSSRSVAAAPTINASSATVRNIMSELEEFGLLTSPHTSAGRIPSAKGLRFFVDKLLVKLPPTAEDIKGLRQGIYGSNTQEVLNTSARLISNITQYAGFIVTPPQSAPVIQQLQFVKLSSERILAVMELSSGDVINRFLDNNGAAVSASMLAAAANLYNEHFSGNTIEVAKQLLEEEVSALNAQIRTILNALLASVDSSVSASSGGLQVFGKTNLANAALGDIARLQGLYDLLNQQQALLHLLQDSSIGEEVHLFIGSECGLEAMDDCALVFSSCGEGEGKQPLGVIGVIGPKRMRYNKIIPTVDITAKMLKDTLDNLHRRD